MDSYITPSYPNVTAIAATASGAVEVATTFVSGRWLFQADGGNIWLHFGGSGIESPVVADATSTGRCIKIPKDTNLVIELKSDQTYFNAIGAETTQYLRRWLISPGA